MAPLTLLLSVPFGAECNSLTAPTGKGERRRAAAYLRVFVSQTVPARGRAYSLLAEGEPLPGGTRSLPLGWTAAREQLIGSWL